VEVDQIIKAIFSDLCILREWLVEVQTRIVGKANMSHRLHDFNVGNSAFLNTRLLLISYSNITQL
jgi:hypothetical protein